MALTSVFYDGPVTETDRAKNRTGAPDYGVYGATDFQVTTNGSVPYSTKVMAGRAHGWGVTDTAATDQTVMHDPPAAGVTRWDLIVVRRNWQPLLGGPSTLVVIKGGAFTDMPVRKTSPGVEDDQPIAMVGWKGGQSAPFQIIDLRCWAANGGMEVVSEIALEYLGKPGTCVKFGEETYRYTRMDNGTWGWIIDGYAGVSTSGLVQVPGWSLLGSVRASWFSANVRRFEVDVNIQRIGTNVDITTTFLNLGGLIATDARGYSGGVKYLPIVISGGSGGNGTLGMAFVNTETGQIGIRSSIGTTFKWTSGASATLNFAYFI